MNIQAAIKYAIDCVDRDDKLSDQNKQLVTQILDKIDIDLHKWKNKATLYEQTNKKVKSEEHKQNKKMTNEDKFGHYYNTDEKVQLLKNHRFCFEFCTLKENESCKSNYCTAGVKRWLKQEADDEGV